MRHCPPSERFENHRQAHVLPYSVHQNSTRELRLPSSGENYSRSRIEIARTQVMPGTLSNLSGVPGPRLQMDAMIGGGRENPAYPLGRSGPELVAGDGEAEGRHRSRGQGVHTRSTCEMRWLG